MYEKLRAELEAKGWPSFTAGAIACGVSMGHLTPEQAMEIPVPASAGPRGDRMEENTNDESV